MELVLAVTSIIIIALILLDAREKGNWRDYGTCEGKKIVSFDSGFRCFCWTDSSQ